MAIKRSNAPLRISPRALVAGLLVAGMSAAAFSSHGADSQDAGARDSGSEPKADKAVVTPYETRPAPSHRVSLHDDRVYFVKQLEETGNGFVLHTLEGETIEVDRSEVAEIVQFRKE